jgi:hypothetical protein
MPLCCYLKRFKENTEVLFLEYLWLMVCQTTMYPSSTFYRFAKLAMNDNDIQARVKPANLQHTAFSIVFRVCSKISFMFRCSHY